MSSLRDATARHVLTDCEAACRRWCAECLRLSALAISPADRTIPSWRAEVLDGAYVASATMRELAGRADHDWGALLMQVGACEQIAGRSVAAWRRVGDPRLRNVIAAGCECAIACAALLRTLVPRQVATPAEQAA